MVTNTLCFVYKKVAYLLKVVPLMYIMYTNTLIISNITIGNVQAQTTYRDLDGDGLIEISFIEALDSIRYNLTGTCSGSTCNGYELTRELDFRNSASYRSGSVNISFIAEGGWNPIGDSTDAFNTTFEGNGWAINYLYIKRISTYYVGFFGLTEFNSRIRNIGLINIDIYGSDYVGGLVGSNLGAITQSYTTGSVSGSYYTGGLVGDNYQGTINQSYSTVSVSGEESVGGLVGGNSGNVTQSYATGAVSGSTFYVGGLVGDNYYGIIIQSYATGAVSGNRYAGGLVGENSRYITQSYATGPVSGSSFSIGGLVGGNLGTITQSYATGSASSYSYYAGGLVGHNYRGTISQGYATGSVSGTTNVGGLVGNNYQGTITQAYATGSVSALSYIGGLVGNNNTGTINHGYWNRDATQRVDGIARSNNEKVGIETTSGSVLYMRGLTLSDLQSDTESVIDSIRELGPGFIYNQNFLPAIHEGARLTINGVNFTQTTPSKTNIDTISSIANVNNGTDTTRATIIVARISFTANIIETTDIIYPYTITNIQNGLREPQTITFAPLNIKIYRDAPFAINASSSASLPVMFSASSTLVSINNNTVTINEVGVVNITAYNMGNSNYSGAFATQALIINELNNPLKTNPTLTFSDLPYLSIGQKYVLIATSNSPVPINFVTSNVGKISITGNTVLAKTTGNVIVTAIQAANAAYNSATATQNITFINPVLPIPKLTFTAIPNFTIGQTHILTATSNSPVAITFNSSNNRIISISKNTLTAVDTGTVVITASQERNAQFNPATAQQTVTVFNMFPITSIEKESSAVVIYPNPANDYITIQIDKNQKISSVKIYDINTRDVYNTRDATNTVSTDGTHHVSTKNLPKGEYIIIVYGEKKQVLLTTKIIKN